MKKIIYLLSLLFVLFGCEKDDSLPELPKNPTAVHLVFPYENSLCNEGTNLTPNESTVLFEWETGKNTDTYELHIKNLNSGNSTIYQTSKNKYSVVLPRGTPYEWYILSLSNTVNETVQSAVWKFYNADDGVQSYAPFPAEIISPAMAATITNSSDEITLDWEGNDVDDDIVAYDLYFGIENTPLLFKSSLTESILNNVPVSLNTVYFWKITTIDSRGNKSNSDIYQFKIL